MLAYVNYNQIFVGGNISLSYIVRIASHFLDLSIDVYKQNIGTSVREVVKYTSYNWKQVIDIHKLLKKGVL